MKHELRMKVLSSDVTKQGVSFTLHDENGKSGTLEIRPGSITWYSGTKAPKNKCVVNWSEFDDFMREHKAK
jgi:hypothetical protein